MLWLISAMMAANVYAVAWVILTRRDMRRLTARLSATSETVDKIVHVVTGGAEPAALLEAGRDRDRDLEAFMKMMKSAGCGREGFDMFASGVLYWKHLDLADVQPMISHLYAHWQTDALAFYRRNRTP